MYISHQQTKRMSSCKIIKEDRPFVGNTYSDVMSIEEVRWTYSPSCIKPSYANKNIFSNNSSPNVCSNHQIRVFSVVCNDDTNNKEESGPRNPSSDK